MASNASPAVQHSATARQTLRIAGLVAAVLRRGARRGSACPRAALRRGPRAGGHRGGACQRRPQPLAPGARCWLHAHNCYPEDGRWADRLSRDRRGAASRRHRAGPGLGSGRAGSRCSHTTAASRDRADARGALLPRGRPMLERALAGRRDRDVAGDRAAPRLQDQRAGTPRAVWDLLGRHARVADVGAARRRRARVQPCARARCWS